MESMKKRDAFIIQMIIGLLGLGYVAGATYIVSSYESGFAVSNNTANQVLASDNQFENPVPVITAMTPGSGPIGTIIELRGENLAGFEGDLDAYIENKKGEKGFLPGIGSVPPKDGVVRVKIESKVCKKNNTYSGLSCDSYMSIGPGLYRVYVLPWGVKSNEMTFAVTK